MLIFCPYMLVEKINMVRPDGGASVPSLPLIVTGLFIPKHFLKEYHSLGLRFGGISDRFDYLALLYQKHAKQAD